jgi:ELWxxDGT repeat protein
LAAGFNHLAAVHAERRARSSPGTTSSGSRNSVVSGSRMYFPAASANGVELWFSDGVAYATQLVEDINPGPGSSNPQNFLLVNGVVYFTADDGTSGVELWRTLPGGADVARVKDLNPGAASGLSPSSELVAMNGMLYFEGTDGASGFELWTTDGTDAGTVRVMDINPGAPDGMTLGVDSGFIAIDGTLFFVARTVSTGFELWKTDGSAAGTVMVKDINPGIASSLPRP